MRIAFAFLFLLLGISSSIAGDAFFRPESRKHIELKEGDSFKGVIELWNVENISPEMIAQLEGKTFLDHFYVVNLEKPEWSENNPQVVVISGSFILQKSLQTSLINWKHGGLQIPVTIKEIKTTDLKDKRKGFVVLDGKYQFEEDSGYNKYYAFAFALLILFLFIFLLKRKKNPRIVVRKELIDWKECLTNAKTKEQFSHIYLSKNEWIEKIQNKEVATKDFFNCASLYLFKPDVEDHELEELKISIEIVLKGMVS